MNQNDLKRNGSHYWVVYYNPEVELVSDNRAFPFKLNPKSYVICLILEILVGFYFETPHQNVLKLLA